MTNYSFAYDHLEDKLIIELEGVDDVQMINCEATKTREHYSDLSRVYFPPLYETTHLTVEGCQMATWATNTPVMVTVFDPATKARNGGPLTTEAIDAAKGTDKRIKIEIPLNALSMNQTALSYCSCFKNDSQMRTIIPEHIFTGGLGKRLNGGQLVII